MSSHFIRSFLFGLIFEELFCGCSNEKHICVGTAENTIIEFTRCCWQRFSSSQHSSSLPSRSWKFNYSNGWLDWSLEELKEPGSIPLQMLFLFWGGCKNENMLTIWNCFLSSKSVSLMLSKQCKVWVGRQRFFTKALKRLFQTRIELPKMRC